MSTWFRDTLGLVAAGLILGVHATPAAALPAPGLRVYADGFIYDSSVGAVGPFQEQNAATGPLLASVEAGAVLTYPSPDYDLETTLYARGLARADYGSNGGAAELNFRATNGTDRGAYPSGNFSGSLPFNSTLEPHASAQSSWTDTFVILGGTGTGTATANVALHGHAESRYGANGTIWYETEPSFETFGTNGNGFAQYALDIRYDALPLVSMRNTVNRSAREQSYPAPLPGFVTEVNVEPDILTGSFVFEYGVPFALLSSLTVNGYNQSNIDFDHTATLSSIELPEGTILVAVPVTSIRWSRSPPPRCCSAPVCWF